jgi:DNA-binding protein H-NS
MVRTLKQIESAIEKLQREADELRKAEVAGVVERIREAIAVYRLTPEQLFGKAKTPKKRAGKVAGNGAGRIKYRDDAGNTWTGRGRRPQWYLDALTAGKTETDLHA